MAITYPISMPTGNAVRSVTFTATNAVAYSRSPFTFEGQSHAYAGEMWSADISLKPMAEGDAEAWSAWLTSLRGRHGKFYLGNPFRNSLRSSAAPSSVTITAPRNAERFHRQTTVAPANDHPKTQRTSIPCGKNQNNGCSSSTVLKI